MEMIDCAAKGCDMRTASPHNLCKRHFAMLPVETQQKLLREYAVDEGNTTPFLIARLKAIRWLNERMRDGKIVG